MTQAWSKIIQILIPNLKFLNQSLQQICEVTQCDEIILFEKSTFLIIAFYEKESDPKNILKYERISTIVKLFKLSCNKIGTEISNMSIQNPNFHAVIDDFTSNTFILLISRNKNIRSAALSLNIDCARTYFKKNSNLVANILFE